MKTKPNTLLLHPFFLLSLLLLLLNDAFFKHEYHNWLTGKLSDFMGLFAFAVFTIAISPSRKITILLLISVAFIWWKSPLSEPFIFYLNNQLHLPFHRVVDYSDYIALSMLPLAYFIKPILYSPSLPRQIAIGCICLFSLSLFVADSLPKYLTDDNKVVLGKSITTKKSRIYILQNLEKNGLIVKDDSAFDRYFNNVAYLRSANDSGQPVYTPVNKVNDPLYTKVYGSVYRIPEVRVGADTIRDLQIVITDNYNRTNVELRNFSYAGMDEYNSNYRALQLRKKLRKPIKKMFKELVK